jgi:hypothetical protein
MMMPTANTFFEEETRDKRQTNQNKAAEGSMH